MCGSGWIRAVASGPAGQAMAGPVFNYVDTHAQMQQLSATVDFTCV